MNSAERTASAKPVVVVVALVAAFVAGFLLRGCGAERHPAPETAQAAPRQTEMWTCSMHPQIRQPRPGKCPLCAMDLIPVGGDGEEGDDRGPVTLAMSETARKLAEVTLAPVERRPVKVPVRMLGKVGLDETRVAVVAPRVSGRIDRLYVNFVGAPVKVGDRLADLYSPELISAQEELIQASGAARALESRGADAAGLATARANLESVREKLRLLQLTPAQIAEVEQAGKPREHVEFYSPLAGVVLDRLETFEGAYVEMGMKLFTLADLSRVWISLDAYESDLGWLRCGQAAAFQVEAYPGETFQGTVSFIEPVLDPMTRTAKVRVVADNADGRLKPEMFVRAVVGAKVSGAGEPADPEGPETSEAEDLPLVIPASAPLVTGERAVVYVAVPGKEGSFEGREVELGPRAGEWQIVKSGLRDGELVVANGSFKIDSSLQIQGRASMMQSAADTPEQGVQEKQAAIPVAADAGQGSPAPKPQTLCPVMGGAIDRKYHADYGGYRVYFCCPGCEEPFLKDAENHLARMRADGIEPEKAPVEATSRP